jgi:hypothetical protein
MGDQQLLRLAKRGVRIVRDLVQPDTGQYRTADALRVPPAQHQRVLAALPERWRAVLERGPAPPRVGEVFATGVELPVGEVVRVARSAIGGLVTGYYIYPDTEGIYSEQDFEDAPEQDVVGPLYRAQVVDLGRGRNLVEGTVDRLDAHPARLELLQADPTGRISHKPLLQATAAGTRGALKAAAAESSATPWTVDRPSLARRAWAWTWHPLRDNKVADFLWRVQHRALQLGVDRRRWADDETGGACPFCKLHVETYEHLFQACAASTVHGKFNNFWQRASGHLAPASLVTPTSQPRARSASAKARALLLPLLQGELVYSLWLQRNRALFDHDAAAGTPAAVWGSFRARATRLVQTLSIIKPHLARSFHRLISSLLI